MRFTLPTRIAWPLAFVAMFGVSVMLMRQRQALMASYTESERTVGRLTKELLATAGFEPVKPAAQGTILTSTGQPFDMSACRGQANSPCVEPVNAVIGASPSAAVTASVSLGERFAARDSAAYTLIVLFSPTDCPVCLTEATVWGHLHADFGDRLAMVAVVDRTTSSELSLALTQLGIAFPTYLDKTSVVRRTLRLSETPYKFLLDPAGNVVFVDGAHRESADQEQLGNRIRHVLEQTHHG